MQLIWLSLLISVAINSLMFIVAFRRKSDKLTDISYAASFVAVTLFVAWRSQNQSFYNLVVTLLVCLWAIRIGGFLLIRIFKSGRDKRFDGVREHFLKFGRFWLGQALTVWLLLLPVEMVVRRPGTFHKLSAIALIIWTIGLVIESLADYQKYRFRALPDNKGHWIDKGLWHYSRHPNYFGEILVWVGIYFFCFSALDTRQRLVGLISPALISGLLLFVSGIPPLEKSADKRWGDDESYKLYKARTSLLVPFVKSGQSAKN